MCYQTFITFQCGCRRVTEGQCEYADQLDVPFWRKMECADYKHEHVRPSDHCGLGKYYCGKTTDSQFLDRIEARFQQTERRRRRAFDEVESRKRILLGKRAEWIAQGATVYDFEASPEMKMLANTLFAHDLERRRQETNRNTWMQVKMLAQHHHDRQQQGQLAGASFEQFLRFRYPQVLVELNKPSRKGSTDATSSVTRPGTSRAQPGPEPRSVRQMQSMLQTAKQPMLRTMPLQVAAANAKHHKQHSQGLDDAMPKNTAQVALLMPREHMLDLARQHAAQLAIPEVQAHMQQRARAKRQKIEAPSSPEKSSSVRRSSRVKNKKINYRDDVSDISQASSSPIKSDSSYFSPGKSEPAQSPVKPHSNVKKPRMVPHELLIAERKMSLADKIGDWRRHDSGMGSPSGNTRVASPQVFYGVKRKLDGEALQVDARIGIKQEPAMQQLDNMTHGPFNGRLALLNQRSFDLGTTPDFQSTPTIKREGSDNIDPIKRIKGFHAIPHNDNGGILSAPMQMPMEKMLNVSPPGSTSVATNPPGALYWPHNVTPHQTTSVAQPLPSPGADQTSSQDLGNPHASNPFPMPGETGLHGDSAVGLGLLDHVASIPDGRIYSDIDWNLINGDDDAYIA